MNNIIEVSNLSYSQNKERILENISFIVREKESVALLGYNGSGKSTLIDIICNLIIYTSKQYGGGQNVEKPLLNAIQLYPDNHTFKQYEKNCQSR